MTLADIIATITTIPVEAEGKTVTVFKSTHYYHPHALETKATADKAKRIFAAPTLTSLINQTVVSEEQKSYCLSHDFSFYGTGWQSWGFGGETNCGKYQKDFLPLIPQFKNYITMPGGSPVSVRKRSKLLTGQFIIYFRWGSTYLVVASTGNSLISQSAASCLPPVEFTINRKDRILTCSIDAAGKTWKDNDIVAELSIFSVTNFFELSAVIASLYTSPSDTRFASCKELSLFPQKIITGGWESWYNHYANINENLIAADLYAIAKNDNFVKTYIMPKTKNVVFQVDDGWEKSVGDWQYSTHRFPKGMQALASSIAKEGYVPGLWIAPFLVDWRSDFRKEHSDWMLRNKKGKPVEAGFNPTWGAFAGKAQPARPYSFFCLDLSNDAVLSYLDALMNRIINEWGFRYIKLDFLYAGMLNGCFKNGGSAYEWNNRALKTLTARTKNNKGETIVYLGCGMPFETSFNYLPLSRIGPDTKETWDINSLKHIHFSGRPGAIVNMKSTLGHSFWNENIYVNDPDVIFLRDTNITLTNTEKELIALVNFLFAGQLMISDDMTEQPTPLTANITALYNKFAGEKFGLVNITENTICIFSKSKTFCGIINLADKPFSLSKNNFLSLCGISENTSLTPEVMHTTVSAQNILTAERHSITIFSVSRI